MDVQDSTVRLPFVSGVVWTSARLRILDRGKGRATKPSGWTATPV
jgi:hypothetical protein